MTLEEKLHWNMAKQSAHNFIFGFDTPAGNHVHFLSTKDEHRSDEPVQPFPDLPYLRAVLDLYLLGGHFIEPNEALYAKEWGIGDTELHRVYDSCLIAIEKSRQVMITWVSLAYVLWRAKFFDHQLILVQSKREDDVKSLVCDRQDSPDSARLTFMETHLPLYMRSMRSCVKCNIYFHSGSRVWGIPQGGSIIRSNTSSLLFSDEAAFQPEFGEAFTAALPAIRGGGQGIFVSSAEIGDFQELVEATV